MITMVTQGVMSPLYKFPSREYSFRSTVILIRIVCERERERILASLSPNLTVKRSSASSSSSTSVSSVKKRREYFLVLRRPIESPRVFVPTFFATREPLYRFIVNETTTWIKKLDSDDSGGGGVGNDWPRAQINSRLDACTWRLRNNMKSDGFLRVYCHWHI